jgi:hypothetical protein
VQAGVGHPFLFLGDGDGELLAAFAAATLEHFATIRGAHALAETMGPFPALSVWLISPLHFVLRSPRDGQGELAFPMCAVNDRSPKICDLSVVSRPKLKLRERNGREQGRERLT